MHRKWHPRAPRHPARSHGLKFEIFILPSGFPIKPCADSFPRLWQTWNQWLPAQSNSATVTMTTAPIRAKKPKPRAANEKLSQVHADCYVTCCQRAIDVAVSHPACRAFQLLALPQAAAGKVEHLPGSRRRRAAEIRRQRLFLLRRRPRPPVRRRRPGQGDGAVAVMFCSCGNQRWPESLFPTPLLFQNFWIRNRVRKFFKIENPTPLQTPATIDTIENYQWFYFRNDRADSCCCCRNWKVAPGPVFQKFLTPGPDPKEKRRILSESTPVLRIRCYLWRKREVWSTPR